MGGGGDGGGGGGYEIDKGRSRATTGYDNDAQIARLKTQYLADKSARLKDIYGLQGDINSADYASLDLKRQQDLELQNRAQAATRGGEATQLYSAPLITANSGQQQDYAKKIQDLINAPFTYDYAPKITGEGLRSYADYQAEAKGYEDQLADLNSQIEATNLAMRADPNNGYVDKVGLQKQLDAINLQIADVTKKRDSMDTGDMNAQKQFEDEQAAKKSQLKGYIEADKSGFQAVYTDYDKSLKQRQADRLKPSESVVKGMSQSAGQEASGNFIPDLPDPNAKINAANKAGVPTSPLTPKKAISNSIIQSNMVGSNEGFLGQSNAL